MHDIEPFTKWRDFYVSSEDEKSPFYGASYSEFVFSNKIYNYLIHPQWDSFGSQTLYAKLLYSDYERQFCFIELIGEWNDCLNNDIMYLKREVVDPLIRNGIRKFIVLCDNVLNFHSDDDCYYEEWFDDVAEENGWIYFLNTRQHVLDEMNDIYLRNFVFVGEEFNDVDWRTVHPKNLFNYLENKVQV
jgi:hypothetical protein